MSSGKYRKSVKGVIFFFTVLAVALTVRCYRLAEIQPHHDESPIFGFTRGTPLRWEGSLAGFLSHLVVNAGFITEGDTTPAACLIAELFRFGVGENLLAARLLHALIQSLGVAGTAWLAWRIFRPGRTPALAVAALGIFSIPSVIFGQFGEMYAIFFAAAVIQYVFYWTVLRKDFSLPGYLVFAIVAYLCVLLEYLQVWVTLGLLLGSVLERAQPRRIVRLLRALAAGILYALFNVMPVFYLLSRSGLAAGARGYYLSYYPSSFSGVPSRPGIGELIYYLFSRTYDLLNYHLSLVFDPGLYRPLRWNWVSLPFLLVLAAGAVIRLKKGRKEQYGVFPALAGILIVVLAANCFSLIPYGGIRNLIIFAPLFWLIYAAAVAQCNRFRLPRIPRASLQILLVGLPLLPFMLSWPGLYRDRISRCDLSELEKMIVEHRPDTLIMAEATYDPFRMILQRHPAFITGVLERYGVELTSFFELGDERWGKYPLPVPGEKVIALDFYLPDDGAGVGYGIVAYHPSLRELCGPGWDIEPLVEKPGAYVDIAQHQSIYYPPNSFYLYLLRRIGEISQE
jgi:hypothetical protein